MVHIHKTRHVLFYLQFKSIVRICNTVEYGIPSFDRKKLPRVFLKPMIDSYHYWPAIRQWLDHCRTILRQR